MTDLQNRVRAEDRPDIEIDGEIYRSRKRWAKEKRISDKTASRLNLPTLYFAGVAHIAVNKSLRQIASHARCRNEPPKRRRGR